jgi:hypothetical protein
MTLSPEQFNLLATKEDLSNFLTRDEFNYKFDKILTAVDGLAKGFDNFRAEMASNQSAHDRFEESISRLNDKTKSIANKLEI